MAIFAVSSKRRRERSDIFIGINVTACMRAGRKLIKELRKLLTKYANNAKGEWRGGEAAGGRANPV